MRVVDVTNFQTTGGDSRADANLNRVWEALDKAGRTALDAWTSASAVTDGIYPAILIELPVNAEHKIDQYRLRVVCTAYTWAPSTADMTDSATNTMFKLA